MKINSINTYNNYNLDFANRQKALGVQVQADKISLNNIQFKGAADVFIGLNENIGIRRQASDFKKEADAVKHKASKIMEEGDFRVTFSRKKLLKKSKQILNQAHRVMKNSISTIKSLKDNDLTVEIDGDITRTFSLDKDNVGVLNEEKNGKLIRQSIYKGRELVVFEYNEDNSIDYYVFDLKTRTLNEFAQGFNSNGSIRSVENRYCFENGQLSSYEYKYETKDGQNKSALRRYLFENGYLKEYSKNYFTDFKGLKRYFGYFKFDKNNLAEYKENYRVQDGVCESSTQDYRFENYKITSCAQGNDIKYGVSEETKEKMDFVDGLLSRVEVNSTLDEKGVKRIQYIYDFVSKNSKLIKYTQGYQANVEQNSSSVEEKTKKVIYF